VGARGTLKVRRYNVYTVEKSRSSFKSFPENEGKLEDFIKLGVLRTSGSSVVEAARFNRTKIVPSIYIRYIGVSPISSISIARISFSYLFFLIRIISAVCRSYIVGYTSFLFYSFILLLIVALSLC
jgi:hypothetical protein